jgi:hypothetical protein
MTTFLQFADSLADVSLASVATNIDGIPKTLAGVTLPALWADMPSAAIRVDGPFATLTGSGTQFSATMWIAVSKMAEGLPDAQRTAVLTTAEELRQWAEAMTYGVEIDTTSRVTVAAEEFRGVTAIVTYWDME